MMDERVRHFFAGIPGMHGSGAIRLERNCADFTGWSGACGGRFHDLRR